MYRKTRVIDGYITVALQITILKIVLIDTRARTIVHTIINLYKFAIISHHLKSSCPSHQLEKSLYAQ